MSASLALGLLLALATAFGSVAGFLYKFRGARRSPEVQLRRPVRSTIALFRSPVYTLGIAIGLGSWMVHVGALALAPISLVQATVAGGLVLLTFAADLLFGITVSRREWTAVALAAAGLAALAATLPGASGAESRYSPGTLYAFVAALCAAGLVLALAHRRGLVLAVSAGLLWAASDTSVKALSSHLHRQGLGVVLDPLALVVAVASLVGLLISARSLQLAEAVPVIALTSVAANLLTIAAGPVVFSERMPHSTVGLLVQLAAFAMVIVAAALIPPAGSAPRRGESAGLPAPARSAHGA
jgi:hypothetical protein